MKYQSFYSRYKYIRKLGQGGCGEVFLAQNRKLGNLWAVKEIIKNKDISASGWIEPEILKHLNHPALPRICDVYEDEEKIYIVEDYLEGTCLQQALEEQGRFEEQQAVDWTIQLCRVLVYLHCQKPEPIIYGDLKPHNIILTKEGFIKLIDFGVSTFLKNGAGSNPGETTFIGTLGYAAPEQYLGEGPNCTSDIYSLGITAIQLMTGLTPARSLPAFDEHLIESAIPSKLFSVFKKCIHSDFRLRYPSAGALLEELQSYHEAVRRKDSFPDKIPRRGFTQITAITGPRGSGVSTLTAAFAEQAARLPTQTCIIDLSQTASLQRAAVETKWGNSLQGAPSEDPVRVSKNLFYQNLSSFISHNSSEASFLYRQLARMQNQFSHIFIDMDMELLQNSVQYVDYIFFVSDMNPANLYTLGKALTNRAPIDGFAHKTSFIINKFYKGELSSATVLKSLLIGNDSSPQLEMLMCNARLFEVLYDRDIYLKGMYSYFDERTKVGDLTNKPLNQAVSAIFSAVAREQTKS